MNFRILTTIFNLGFVCQLVACGSGQDDAGAGHRVSRLPAPEGSGQQYSVPELQYSKGRNLNQYIIEIPINKDNEANREKIKNSFTAVVTKMQSSDWPIAIHGIKVSETSTTQFQQDLKKFGKKWSRCFESDTPGIFTQNLIDFDSQTGPFLEATATFRDKECKTIKDDGKQTLFPGAFAVVEPGFEVAKDTYLVMQVKVEVTSKDVTAKTRRYYLHQTPTIKLLQFTATSLLVQNIELKSKNDSEKELEPTFEMVKPTDQQKSFTFIPVSAP